MSNMFVKATYSRCVIFCRRLVEAVDIGDGLVLDLDSLGLCDSGDPKSLPTILGHRETFVLKRASSL